MKKRYIMTVLLILFTVVLSVSFVSAWGWGAFECQGFNLEQPDGIEIANGYTPDSPPDHVKLVKASDSKIDWRFIVADLSEVPFEKLPDGMDIAENHTENGITIIKGQSTEDISVDFSEGTNMTYAEFDKDGKHFYLAIDHLYSSFDQIDLTNDLNLAKELQKSIKLK